LQSKSIPPFHSLTPFQGTLFCVPLLHTVAYGSIFTLIRSGLAPTRPTASHLASALPFSFNSAGASNKLATLKQLNKLRGRRRRGFSCAFLLFSCALLSQCFLVLVGVNTAVYSQCFLCRFLKRRPTLCSRY
jgi:hypothetical protein